VEHMYLARSRAQIGQPEASKNEWQRALEATNGDVGKLMTLAEYAEKNGASAVAASAYTQATAPAPNLRAAWQGRLRVAYAAKETKRIHEILAQMLQLWPNDTAIQNDEAYTRLLLLPGGTGAVPSSSGADAGRSENNLDATAGVPPTSASAQLIAIEKLAKALVEREPSSLPHRTLLALALLKQNRAVAALQVYDGIQVAPNALTPSGLAVHAAVLSANGNRDAARTEIQQVPIERLLPEEQSGTANLRDSP
ncbi:MAG: hypothetical protein M3Y86_00130, partial [Verrucomicrobiota bacterium]|nr:hypothetical protein [Verrucomicrobiota bacterium]